MLIDCVRDSAHCSCSCHRFPGIRHVMPCCNQPSLEMQELIERMRTKMEAGVEYYMDQMNKETYSTDRDPGNENTD